jgi:hypothetical protein
MAVYTVYYEVRLKVGLGYPPLYAHRLPAALVSFPYPTAEIAILSNLNPQRKCTESIFQLSVRYRDGGFRV